MFSGLSTRALDRGSPRTSASDPVARRMTSSSICASSVAFMSLTVSKVDYSSQHDLRPAGPPAHLRRARVAPPEGGPGHDQAHPEHAPPLPTFTWAAP